MTLRRYCVRLVAVVLAAVALWAVVDRRMQPAEPEPRLPAALAVRQATPMKSLDASPLAGTVVSGLAPAGERLTASDEVEICGRGSRPASELAEERRVAA